MAPPRILLIPAVVALVVVLYLLHLPKLILLLSIHPHRFFLPLVLLPWVLRSFRLWGRWSLVPFFLPCDRWTVQCWGFFFCIRLAFELGCQVICEWSSTYSWMVSIPFQSHPRVFHPFWVFNWLFLKFKMARPHVWLLWWLHSVHSLDLSFDRLIFLVLCTTWKLLPVWLIDPTWFRCRPDHKQWNAIVRRTWLHRDLWCSRWWLAYYTHWVDRRRNETFLDPLGRGWKLALHSEG